MKENNRDSLGDRMKTFENVSRYQLIRRMPVIIRLDGKAFHTFTKVLKHIDPSVEQTPFSLLMHEWMASTTSALMQNIQNAKVTYSQSDEITILLRDWDKHETEQWFDGNIQKIVSIASSIASTHFSHLIYKSHQLPPIQFDARVFNLPESEVVNNFIWRQKDATRNSIQMLGRHYFSHKQMHEKNVSHIQDMLMLEKGVNWNDIPTWMRRGFCVTRDGVDREIPIFTQDRDYIGKFLEISDAE